MPVLIAFAGLPGVGKSTIAAEVSRRTGAVYLRLDEIDHAIEISAPGQSIRPVGFTIYAGLAVSNLKVGHSVVIDCVNPDSFSRNIFAAAAREACANFSGVEIVCSDRSDHKVRIDTRPCDPRGWTYPNWGDVSTRDYQTWDDSTLRIDTARTDVETAISRVCAPIIPGRALCSARPSGWQ